MNGVRIKSRAWAALIPLGATGLAICANLGVFYWGGSPEWYHVAASVLFLTAWAGFRLLCPGRGPARLFCAVGIGMLLNGLTALGAVVCRGAVSAICMPPARVMSVAFAAPVSGLLLLMKGNVLRWICVTLIGVVWPAVGWYSVQRVKE